MNITDKEYKYDVFLSFTGGDRELKTDISNRLLAKGYKTYDSDVYCKGQFRENYVEALEASRVYLLFLTDSLRNDRAVSGKGSFSEVRKELNLALELEGMNELNIVILCTSEYFHRDAGLRDYRDTVSRFYYSSTRGYTMEFDTPDSFGHISDRAFCSIEATVSSFITERNNGTPILSQTPKIKLETQKLPERSIFVGRESEIERARDAFKDGRRIVVLSGIGGIGKTALANEIARRCHEEGILKCPQTVHIQELSGGGGLMKATVSSASYTSEVYAAINNLSERDKYEMKLRALSELPDYILLVIDNYNSLTQNDIDDIYSRLGCHVLITTRSQPVANSEKVHTVPVSYMSPELASVLFSHHYGGEIDSADFTRLYNYTGGHTQTLCIIARTMALHGMGAGELLDKMNSSGKLSAKVEFRHNDFSENATVTEHLTRLFDISGFDAECLNILRQMSLLSDGRISAEELISALKLDTRNELLELTHSGWLEHIKQDGAEYYYIHPIISRLMASLLAPSEENSREMIDYLIRYTEEKKQGLTYSDANLLNEKLYYALHVLVLSDGRLHRELFGLFTQINNIIGCEENDARLSELLAMSADEGDRALVMSYRDTLCIYTNPFRIDILDRYLQNIEKSSNNYKWTLGTLSVVAPFLSGKAEFRKRLKSLISTAIDAAIYKEDDLATAMLLVHSMPVDNDGAIWKKVNRYIKARKKQGVMSGDFSLLTVLSISGTVLFKSGNSDTLPARWERLMAELAEISNSPRKTLLFGLKHPVFAFHTIFNSKYLTDIPEGDPMRPFFDSINGASEKLAQEGILNIGEIFRAAVELNKNLTARGYSMQSALDAVKNAMAGFSSLPIAKEQIGKETAQLIEDIDTDTITVSELSTLQVTAHINSQFGNGSDAIRQKAMIVSALRRIRPRGHIDIINTVCDYADTCIMFEKYSEAFDAYDRLLCELSEDGSKAHLISFIARKLLRAIHLYMSGKKTQEDAKGIVARVNPDYIEELFRLSTATLSDTEFEYYTVFSDYAISITAYQLFLSKIGATADSKAVRAAIAFIKSKAESIPRLSAAIQNQLVITAKSCAFHAMAWDIQLASELSMIIKSFSKSRYSTVRSNARIHYAEVARDGGILAAESLEEKLRINKEALSAFVKEASGLSFASHQLRFSLSILATERKYLYDTEKFLGTVITSKSSLKKMLKALDAAKTKFSPIGECFSAEEAKEVRSLILAQAIISISNEIYAKSYGITPKAYSRIHTRDDFVTAAFSAILGEIGKRSWDGKAGVLSGMTAFDTLYYRGEWNGRSLPHGRGELIMANGDTLYKGEFADGRIEGYGIQHFPNGNCYEGDFRSFRFNGKGKFTYASGTYYVGEFKDGQYDGEGKIYFKAGGTDEGQFKSGKLHGKGKRTFPDKSVDEGEFVDGKLTGKGRHIYTDGAVLEGTFLEGRITGLGRLTYCDGSVYEGTFFLGKPRGKGTKTYPDGRVYEGSWRQGKLYGPAACRFPDGGCFSGTFSFGMLQGNGKYTFADGSYCESDSFENNFRSADSAVYTDLNGNIQHGRLEDGVFIPDETPSVQE